MSTMRSVALATLMALAVGGQTREENFRVTVTKWNLPSILEEALPLPPVRGNGVTVVVEVKETAPEMDGLWVTVYWVAGEKKYKRSQYTDITQRGCGPVPCRWALVSFPLGMQADNIQVEVQPIRWVTEEVE